MLPTFELKVEIVWCELPVMGQVSTRDLTCSYCARSFLRVAYHDLHDACVACDKLRVTGF